MDKFVLIDRGTKCCKDDTNRGIVRLRPTCYDKVYALKKRTHLPMSRVLEQCVDFALSHMAEGEYDEYEGDEE